MKTDQELFKTIQFYEILAKFQTVSVNYGKPSLGSEHLYFLC